MIKIVVSDLDGTLIPEGTQDFEEGFFETLKELLDQGYEFYAASGRPHVNMYQIFGEFSDRIGYLADNGAIAFQGTERFFVEEVDRELAEAVITYANELDYVDVLVSGVEYPYIFPKTEWYENNMRTVYGLPVVVTKEAKDIGEPIIKMSWYIYDFDKNAEAFKQCMTERFGEYGDFVHTGNEWIDMIVKGSGKGKALQALLERKGASPDEVMTFGDNYNDISMLEVSKNSYAKTNAPAVVKAAACHETDSVVKTIREQLLR